MILELRRIFPEDELPLRSTRFKQKADFYSIFLTINDLHRGGFTGQGKDLSHLRLDIRLLDRFIAPQSPVATLSEYAIKCVSQANSVASRAWRRDLLTMILNGTFRQQPPFAHNAERFTELFEQISEENPAGLFNQCVVCEGNPADHAPQDRSLAWPEGTTEFQLSNGGWAVGACRPGAGT